MPIDFSGMFTTPSAARGRVISVTPRGSGLTQTERKLRSIQGGTADAATRARFGHLLGQGGGGAATGQGNVAAQRRFDKLQRIGQKSAKRSRRLSRKAGKRSRKIGRQALKDVNQRFLPRALADAEQGLNQRGLGNTSIRTTARQGIREGAQRERSLIREGIAARDVGLLQGRSQQEERLGGFQSDLLLSRQDAAPSASLALLQQLAQG